MQANNKPDGAQHRRVKKRFTIDFWIFVVSGCLVIYLRPFAHLFPGLEAYEGFHRVAWPEIAIYATAWALVKTIYLWGFRREEQRREIGLVKEDIKRSRIMRPSFAVRWLFILCMLALASFGWFGAGSSLTHLLGFVLPVVLVLCLLVPALVYRRLDHRAAADG